MLLGIVYHLNSLAKSLIVNMDETDIKDREDSEGTSQVEEEFDLLTTVSEIRSTDRDIGRARRGVVSRNERRTMLKDGYLTITF
jgi:hypothetical protein